MSVRPQSRPLPGGHAGAGRPGARVHRACPRRARGWSSPPRRRAEPVVEAPSAPRPVIAVFGLARGCGATVVARALAAELAGREADGAAAVHCEARAAGIPLATPAAGRLARDLAEVPGTDTRAVGRLCLVATAAQAALVDTARHLAPLVLDAGSTALGGAPAALRRPRRPGSHPGRGAGLGERGRRVPDPVGPRAADRAEPRRVTWTRRARRSSITRGRGRVGLAVARRAPSTRLADGSAAGHGRTRGPRRAGTGGRAPGRPVRGPPAPSGRVLPGRYGCRQPRAGSGRRPLLHRLSAGGVTGRSSRARSAPMAANAAATRKAAW